jgi:hypothetical protein
MAARSGGRHAMRRLSLALRIGVFVGLHAGVLLGVLVFY